MYFFLWVYLYERKVTIMDHMKNILAKNLLRFGVKNLSESTIKRLTEAVSPAGSYKTQIGDAIGTVSFSIKDKTLSLTSNGQIVGQWTIVNPFDRTTGVFKWIPGKNAVTKAFDSGGNLNVTGRSAVFLYGIDKSMLTALTEILNAQPATSPWKQQIKDTTGKTYPQTYADSVKTRIQNGTKNLTNNGIYDQFAIMRNIKADNITLRITAYYIIAQKIYKIYLAPYGGDAQNLKYTNGAAAEDKNLDSAINTALTKLQSMNKNDVAPETAATLKSQALSQISPLMEGLVNATL